MPLANRDDPKQEARKALLGTCDMPGCGRRGVCIPLMMWLPDQRKHLGIPPMSMERAGFQSYTLSFQYYLPKRVSVVALTRRLKRVHHRSWQLACMQCVAVEYVRKVRYGKKRGYWSGTEIFGSQLCSALRAWKGKEGLSSAVTALLPQLENYIVDDLAAFRPRYLNRAVKQG